METNEHETEGQTEDKWHYDRINKYEKHAVNPFVEEAITRVASETVRRTRKVGASNNGAQHLVVNPSTGEVDAYAQFMEIQEVDEDKFTKIYISEFAAFYDLTKPAIKVLHYIISILKPKQDTFILRMDKCLEFTKYTHKVSVFSGLGNLIKSGIIARTIYNEEYYINPMVLFNGNRIAYTKAYIKKKKQQGDLNQNQTLLFPL